MSNLEEVGEMYKDLEDAKDSLIRAEDEILDAIKWRDSRRAKVEMLEKRLQALRNKE